MAFEGLSENSITYSKSSNQEVNSLRAMLRKLCVKYVSLSLKPT